MFYTLISSIMRGLLVLSIFVEFKFTSLNKKIRTIFFRPMGSKKITKEAQNDPTHAKPADQKMHQNAAFRKLKKRAGQRPPRGMVAGGQLLPQLSRFLSQPFVFPRNFSVCAVIFAFKGGCIWTPSTHQFLSFHHST